MNLHLKYKTSDNIELSKLIKIGITSVGSSQNCDIFIENSSIAPEQFVILNEDDSYLLTPQSSGTFLNGIEINVGSRQILKPQDIIKTGNQVFFIIQLNEDKPPNAATEGKANTLRNNRSRSFAEILEEIGRMENAFSLEIDNDKDNTITIDEKCRVLYWSNFENKISKIKDSSAQEIIYLQMNWGGVCVASGKSAEIFVNEDLLSSKRQLVDGDHIRFQIKDLKGTKDIINAVFKEPFDIKKLDLDIPRELPLLPKSDNSLNTLETEKNEEIKISDDSSILENSVKSSSFFKYISLNEMALFAFATALISIIFYYLLSQLD